MSLERRQIAQDNDTNDLASAEKQRIVLEALAEKEQREREQVERLQQLQRVRAGVDQAAKTDRKLLVDEHPNGLGIAVRKEQLPTVVEVEDEDLELDPEPAPVAGKKEKQTVRLRGGRMDATQRLATLEEDLGADLMHKEKREKDSFAANMFQYGMFESVSHRLATNREKRRVLGDESLLYGNGLSAADVVAERQALFDAACLKEPTLGEMAGKGGEGNRKFGDHPDEKIVKDKFMALLREYAGGEPPMDDESFKIRKNVIFKEMEDMATDVKGGGEMFVENGLEMAKQVRIAAEAAGGIENLNIDLELIVGRAKIGAQTERQRNVVDRTLDLLNQQGKIGGVLAGVGRYFNNELSVAVAVATSVGVLTRGVGVRMAALGSAGASMLVTGAFSASKERGKLEQQMARHDRRLAEGLEVSQEEVAQLTAEIAALKEELKTVPRWNLVKRSKLQAEIQEKSEKADPRAVKLHEFAVVGVSARELTGRMSAAVEGGKLRPGLTVAEGTALLGQIDSRMALGKKDQIDYVSFSEGKSSSEKLALEKTRIVLKHALREAFAADTTIDKTKFRTFDDYYAKTHDLFNPPEESELGVEQKKRKEAEKKLATWVDRQAFKRGVTTMAVGATLGAMFGIALQEFEGVMSHGVTGVVDVLRGNHEAGASTTLLPTPLKWLENYLGHGAPTMPTGPSHLENIGGRDFHLPAGTEILHRPDGTDALVNLATGKDIVPNLKIHDGIFDPSSLYHLEHAGIHVNTVDQLVSAGTTSTKTEGVMDWIHNHMDAVRHVHRDGWADNDTAKFDLNELLLQTMKDSHGQNTWLDANGDVVIDVTKMFPGGSFHGLEHFDPTQAIAEGKLHILMSMTKGSAGTPVDLVVNSHGQLVIDHTSDAFKTFFPTVNGHTEYVGQYLEVAVSKGVDAAGVEHVEVLATHIGKGVAKGMTTVDVAPVIHHVTTLVMPPAEHLPDGSVEWPNPYFIPLMPGTDTMGGIDAPGRKNVIPPPGIEKPPVSPPIEVPPPVIVLPPLPPEESTAIATTGKKKEPGVEGTAGGKFLSEQGARNVLGVSETATLKDIQRAMRALVKKYNADNGTEPDEQQMRIVLAAYNQLRDKLQPVPVEELPVIGSPGLPESPKSSVEESRIIGSPGLPEPRSEDFKDGIIDGEKEDREQKERERNTREQREGEALSESFEKMATGIRKLGETMSPLGKEFLDDVLRRMEQANREQSVGNLVDVLQDILEINVNRHDTVKRAFIDDLYQHANDVLFKAGTLESGQWGSIDRGLAKAENAVRIAPPLRRGEA